MEPKQCKMTKKKLISEVISAMSKVCKDLCQHSRRITVYEGKDL